jgi:hypothetical protein
MIKNFISNKWYLILVLLVVLINLKLCYENKILRANEKILQGTIKSISDTSRNYIDDKNRNVSEIKINSVVKDYLTTELKKIDVRPRYVTQYTNATTLIKDTVIFASKTDTVSDLYSTFVISEINGKTAINYSITDTLIILEEQGRREKLIGFKVGKRSLGIRVGKRQTNQKILNSNPKIKTTIKKSIKVVK